MEPLAALRWTLACLPPAMRQEAECVTSASLRGDDYLSAAIGLAHQPAQERIIVLTRYARGQTMPRPGRAAGLAAMPLAQQKCSLWPGGRWWQPSFEPYHEPSRGARELRSIGIGLIKDNVEWSALEGIAAARLKFFFSSWDRLPCGDLAVQRCAVSRRPSSPSLPLMRCHFTRSTGKRAKIITVCSTQDGSQAARCPVRAPYIAVSQP